MAEESFEFLGRAPSVELGETDGYKGAVPAPLVGIEVGRSFRPCSHVVLTQHLLCFTEQPPGAIGEVSRKALFFHTIFYLAWTTTRWTTLTPYPPWFQASLTSTGCVLPDVSVARAHSSCSPGWAFQSQVQYVQA